MIYNLLLMIKIQNTEKSDVSYTKGVLPRNT